MAFDNIVVGAGVMGLSTAWELQSRQRARTLLLEQFPFPHSLGSSAGHSRIYRVAYRQPEYGRLVPTALAEWGRIEELSGRTLMHRCGLLATGPSVDVAQYSATIRESNLPCEELSMSEVARRWPAYANFPGDHRFVFEASAGVLAASLALEVLRDLFVGAGGSFHDKEKVLEVRPHEQHVDVVTTRATYRTQSVVLTAGPWNIRLLASLGLQLPLQATKTVYAYFPVRGGAKSETFRLDNYPIPIFKDTDAQIIIYGTPEHEFPGHVKFGMHAGQACDPDRRDCESYSPEFVQRMRRFVAKSFPELEPEPSFVEYCMYTDSVDEGFVLDRHPQHRRVVFGTGFSGHGFKLAPVVGRILAELAVDKEPSIPCEKLRLSRFAERAKL